MLVVVASGLPGAFLPVVPRPREGVPGAAREPVRLAVVGLATQQAAPRMAHRHVWEQADLHSRCWFAGRILLGR